MHIRATHDKRKACFTDKASELKQGRKRKMPQGAIEQPKSRATGAGTQDTRAAKELPF
jgi:hypothetical protein